METKTCWFCEWYDGDKLIARSFKWNSYDFAHVEFVKDRQASYGKYDRVLLKEEVCMTTIKDTYSTMVLK